MQTLTDILNLFANDFISVPSTAVLLVPALPLPCNSILCYQDVAPKDCGNHVAFDIFTSRQQNKHLKKFTMNVRFLNNDDKIAYAVHKHITIIQMMDLIAMYDGHGSWDTQCGLLVGHLCYQMDKDNVYIKLKKYANFNNTNRFLELNQKNEHVIHHIEEYYLKQCMRAYCQNDYCAERAVGSAHFCSQHVIRICRCCKRNTSGPSLFCFKHEKLESFRNGGKLCC